MLIKRFIFTIFSIKDIATNKFRKTTGTSSYADIEYRGEHFPIGYLVPDNVTPTESDLKYYLNNLLKMLNYFSNKNPNNTDINQAVGLYYAKALLKRTLKEYGDKFQKNQYNLIANAIKVAENILSHYVYMTLPYGWNDIAFRVSKILRDDSSLIYSVGTFNQGRLKKWILSKEKINDFLQDMDEVVLPKEKYVELGEEYMKSTKYHIQIADSDKCLARAATNPEPIDLTKLQPCRPDLYCNKRIHSSPSVAYTLSHRLFNMIFYRHTRRCYMKSEKEDQQHIDMLCSSMYREAVYIARRGFFARDFFLEHVALCSLMGYEEFHRRHWFHKVASWVDEQGCMQESRNYIINRTKVTLQMPPYKNKKNAKEVRKLMREKLWNECHHHPMVLLLIVLSHAIRHAVHFMQVLSSM